MTTTKAVFHSVTPMVPTGPSFPEALAFYAEELGFAVLWRDGNMAAVRRDGVEFNLIRNDDRAWIDNSSFSIGVTDLGALFEDYRCLAANVGPLEIKPWGRREFHMIVPSGVCLQFYETGG